MYLTELKKLLNDEPICKRLKLADNAYKSNELQFKQKEIFLLKWVIENSNQDYKEYWKHLNIWIKSPKFKNLNRNDVNRDDFISIIKLIQKQLSKMGTFDDNSTLRIILDSILLLTDCDVFQHYFKYHIKLYCELISFLLHKIDTAEYLQEFLKGELFHEKILSQEEFSKHFLFIVCPCFMECLSKFDSVNIFNLISKIVQKCLFYKNHNSFKIFMDQFFKDKKAEEQSVPKSTFKYLHHVYNREHDTETFKIVLHAFSNAYSVDFDLIYKFFILLVHIIGFDLKDKLILHNSDQLDVANGSLKKSQNIIYGLLNVFSENTNNLTAQVSSVTFTEFIRNILKQILHFRKPSTTCYKIILKTIAIDPLLVEPIAENLIIYTMILDTRKCNEYETVVKQIFDVYSKLRRVENLISKIVHTLNHYFNGHKYEFEETYKFNGAMDIEDMMESDIRTEDIFTDNILHHFSNCICSLASWQVINVFKTLLFQLQQILNKIDKNVSDSAVIFAEIICALLSNLLCSVRVAEHTVATNVVDKSLKELSELRNVLQQFGICLLNREHNQRLMRSFLTVAYNWAEVYISLKYYSVPNIELNKLMDNHSTACNLTYLHSYLTLEQWCLISERIANFGEVRCKQLLEKFYIQKLRAMFLFEETIKEDIIQKVIKKLSLNFEMPWGDILEDKFFMNNLLPKMSSNSVISLADKLISNMQKQRFVNTKPLVSNSPIFVTAMQYMVISKITKVLTKKKDKATGAALSVKIALMVSKTDFLSDTFKEIIEKVKSMYRSSENDKLKWNVSEEKIHFLLQVARKFPVIFCSEEVQKFYLLYFCSLHRDFLYEFQKGEYKSLQKNIEKLILGVVEQCKFKLGALFQPADFCKNVVENYKSWDLVFPLVTENVFKDENSVTLYEPIISDFSEKLLVPECMSICITIITIANKMKKIKISKEVKTTIDKYRTTVMDKILHKVLEHQPKAILIDGYAWALRYFLSSNEEEKLSKLLTTLAPYLDFALKNAESLSAGYLMLFVTVLENKLKLQSTVNDDFLLKVWNVCKEKNNSDAEKYAQLVKLIFGLASTEIFDVIVIDLLNITEDAIANKEFKLLTKKLKIWESVLTCDLNAGKIRVLQSALERILQKFHTLLQESFSEKHYQDIFGLENKIICNTHLPLTPRMTDMIILSITLLCDHLNDDDSIFNLSITLMESLLKFRKHLMMDRLPPFLHLYRSLLKNLCERSNTNVVIDTIAIKEVSDCSHQLEKLTKNLVSCRKDMARIAMYLVADILQQYEQITLHQTTKIHLNNCIYSLLSICDQHAIAFLMRSLSSASTEIFKDLYENYKKFYRFTGKV